MTPITTHSGEIIPLDKLLAALHTNEIFHRLENDEEGFYLSIINRQVFPRVWADTQNDGQFEVLAESTEHLLERTVLHSKDWQARFSSETIEGLIPQVIEWTKSRNIIL
jgi:hypothetical protein